MKNQTTTLCNNILNRFRPLACITAVYISYLETMAASAMLEALMAIEFHISIEAFS